MATGGKPFAGRWRDDAGHDDCSAWLRPANGAFALGRPKEVASRRQQAVAWPARPGAIADRRRAGSWSAHLPGIELVHMLEVAGLAARAEACLWARRYGAVRLGRDIRIGTVLPALSDCRGIERQHVPGAGGMIAPGGMPEPRVAHLVQPLRQHVLEEAAHELVAIEAGRAPARRFAMLVADADTGVVEPDDAGLGDGDAEHVAREIVQHRLGAVAPGRAVDDPGLAPGRPGQHEIGPALLQRGPHLGAYEDGERPRRDQEIGPGGMPLAAVIGHTATGDEAMHMRVVDELLRPGVQHCHHADGAADVAPITAQLDDGLRGRLHQRGVAVALVGAQYLAQLRRHGDRDVEIGARQQLRLARRDPALGLILMASRAAPVLAGMIGVDLSAALIAAPQVPAERWRSAGEDVGDGTPV